MASTWRKRTVEVNEKSHALASLNETQVDRTTIAAVTVHVFLFCRKIIWFSVGDTGFEPTTSYDSIQLGVHTNLLSMAIFELGVVIHPRWGIE